MKDPVLVEELTWFREEKLSPHCMIALKLKVWPMSDGLKTCAMVMLSLVSPG